MSEHFHAILYMPRNFVPLLFASYYEHWVGKSLMAAVNLSAGRTSVGVTVNPAKRNLAGEGDAVPCANIEPLGCLMECRKTR